jgi:phosphate transport system substrate-binding protein
VQLPVVNSKRADLKILLTKGFREASFRQIYFKDAPASNDSSLPFTVYKRQKAACSSVSFANHFGNEHKDIKGIGVAGDDQDLLEAVKKDKNAISHNSLGLIYNLKTRKLNDSIAIIPIDLNENGKIDQNEKIYSTVDAVTAFVEKTNHPKIPVENIHVIFSKTINHKAVSDFLEWVVVNGKQFNHEFGLLNLGTGETREQEKLLAQSGTFLSCTPSLTRLKNRSVTSVHKNK